MTKSQEGSNVSAQQQFDQERSEAFAGGMLKGPNSDAMARARGEKAETVVSEDGTPIAYRRSGEGPPLVLVHGATADHGRWNPVLPVLEKHFTVYTVDRRGRGGSGDADGYAVKREFEDIASVVDSIGEPVNLLGHSYGALCSLEAALLNRNIRKLVLCEPAMHITGEKIHPTGTVDRLEALLEAGDRDEVVATVMREIAGLSLEDVEVLRRLPVWQARVAAAHTIPRELRAFERYRFDPRRFRDLGVPALLLGGGESPSYMKVANQTVNRALPDSRIVVVPRQGHAAMDTGTDLFTKQVLRFLTTDA